MKILSFLKKSYSWLVLLPLLLVLVGAASNQAVLIANHGKFPVMLNEQAGIRLYPEAERRRREAAAKPTDRLLDFEHQRPLRNS